MSITDFHISTGRELVAIKDRVRNLVQHWGEDGRYKEAVLKALIRRFLPETMEIATGFIVKPTKDRAKHQVSSQVDLIVYDKAYPVLFKEGDFVIITADAVDAIIEVKANIQNQGFSSVIEKANKVGQFVCSGWHRDRAYHPEFLFNGIFSFEASEKLNPIKALKAIQKQSAKLKANPNPAVYQVNHICFNNNYFFKLFPGEIPEPIGNIYGLQDLSFSYFISNLMDSIVGHSVEANNHMWFPVDKSVQQLASVQFNSNP